MYVYEIILVAGLALVAALAIPYAASWLNMGKHTSHYRSRRRLIRGSMTQRRRDKEEAES